MRSEGDAGGTPQVRIGDAKREIDEERAAAKAREEEVTSRLESQAKRLKDRWIRRVPPMCLGQLRAIKQCPQSTHRYHDHQQSTWGIVRASTLSPRVSWPRTGCMGHQRTSLC